MNGSVRQRADTWLERRLALLEAPRALLHDEGKWGALRLVEALANSGRPVVLCQLYPEDKGDPIAQGNRLAAALSRTFGALPVSLGLAYPYALQVLLHRLGDGAHVTLVLLDAQYAPGLLEDALKLPAPALRVVAHTREVVPHFLPSGEVRLIGQLALRLEREEAVRLAAGRSLGQALELLDAVDGALEPFLALLEPPLPAPPETPHAAPVGDLDAYLGELIQAGRPLQALELAQHLPGAVVQVLKRAGSSLLGCGQPGRLLALLPTRNLHLQDETVVFYALACALELDREGEILGEVELYLRDHDAPEVRALYAEVKRKRGDVRAAYRQAEWAARTRRTPLTLTHYGLAMALDDPETGVALLKEALEASETRDDAFCAARAATALAARHTTLGSYRVAAHYGAWALRVIEQHGLGNVRVRHAALNEHAFAKVFLGEAAEVRETLQREVLALRATPGTANRFLETTLADAHFVSGEVDEALHVYASLWVSAAQRQTLGMLAYLYVRALLEVGDTETALEVSETALSLSEGLDAVYTRRALTARGMALCHEQPLEAVGVLGRALKLFEKPLYAPRYAQAALYLAKAYLLLGDRAAAKKIYSQAAPVLKDVAPGGLHYLAGPAPAFEDVFSLHAEARARLQLGLLGDPVARYDGNLLEPRPRFLEILLALALHPNGLPLERLTLAVYGEAGAPGTCKADVAKLRKVVPIENRPYRLEGEVWLDVTDLLSKLERGAVYDAVRLYRGPLLPASDAPIVVQTRDQVEEALRRAVVREGNAELTLELAERFEDDLELWERALEGLPRGDARHSTVLAKIKHLVRMYG